MDRIDVHCHALPPRYCQQLVDHGHSKPDGMPAIPEWSPEAHIKMMEANHISLSILSISSPGTHLTPGDDAAAASITRQANDDLAAVCTAHPKHFRFFASLALPCVPAALAEIPRAIELGAVGFVFLSNSQGIYPGDARFEPVLAALDARAAVVFLHPTSPAALVDETIPRPIMEFPFDSTRALASLLLSGALERYPRIRFIVSHAGAAVPALLERIGAFVALRDGEDLVKGNKGRDYREILRERVMFDLAGFVFPDQVYGLVKMLGKSATGGCVYGSDYPFTKEEAVGGLRKELDRRSWSVFGWGRKDVYEGNARGLIGLEARDGVWRKWYGGGGS